MDGKKILLETNYQQIYVHEHLELIVHYWKSSTMFMDEYRLERELLNMQRAISNSGTDFFRLLTDATHFGLPIGPHLQHWIATVLVPMVFGAGIRRQAIVASRDFITALTGIQMVEVIEKKFPLYHITMSNTTAEAIDWLMQENI